MTRLPTEDIVIRRALATDAPGIAAFMGAIQAENLDTVRKRAPPTEDYERKEIAEAEAHGHALLLLAIAGEEIVGFLGLWAGAEAHERHAARFGISVGKDWRRRGIGRKLIEFAIHESKTWPGFCRIELECAPHNDGAIRLYESLGFTIEGRKRKSTNLGNGPADMLLMALVW